MARSKILVWGASGHAMVVAELIQFSQEYTLEGFIDDVSPERQGEAFMGSHVLGGREILDLKQKDGVKYLVVGIGDCETRMRAALIAKEKGYQLASLIHPSAIVSEKTQIGDGVVIFAGAVVNPGTKIGDNVIINTSASVDHECVVGDGCHIGPGVRIAGKVTVEGQAWVGIGATILDKIKIGKKSIIGAGAVVTRDIPAQVVAYGVPARVVQPS